ncbi:MAG TPA: amidase family protein [Steroidobacteraceae bacterium]|nr:amidase family protein [Steroidobacteraceae bacterium]
MSNALSRRGFMAGWLAALSAGLRAKEPEDLSALTATEALAGLRRGDFTAERYAAALLRRCQAGAALNAFITLRPEQVLEAARECDRRRRAGAHVGPLHGLPIPIKDSVNTRDLPTTAGTPGLRHFQPAEDAPLVRTLRSAGAIVLGKTNLHELSYGYTSNNHAFGAVHNPYDAGHIPGGSSGGTGAAIAYRMAPLGIAEDTEGSIRVPAALCGIAGFRPTTGRYPTTGCVPITPLFDQLGPHARAVSDLLLFDTVVVGTRAPVLPARRASLKGVRLGVIRPFFYSGLDQEVERIANAALARLQNAGAELVEGDLPDLPRLIALVTDPIQNHDVKPSLTRYLARYHTGITFDELLAQMSPDVRAMIDPAITPGARDFVTDARYAEIVKVHWPALRALYRDYFARSGVAAIVFPATILPAPPIGEESMEVVVRGRRMPLDVAMSRNIAPGSTTGLPGLVLPAGLTSTGLPVALEFDGPSGSDRALLSLGLTLEATLGPIPPPGAARFSST